MSIGNKLKKLRLSRNLSQYEMSKLLHTEQSNYSKYETDKVLPSLDIIKLVMREFNVTSDWLLDSDNNNVSFQEGSINNGAGIVKSVNYNNIPKDIIDTILSQQKSLELLLGKLIEKL